MPGNVWVEPASSDVEIAWMTGGTLLTSWIYLVSRRKSGHKIPVSGPWVTPGPDFNLEVHALRSFNECIDDEAWTHDNLI